MTLDTDATALDDVDLTADIPCQAEECPRPAEWIGRTVGCPHRHGATVCDPHATAEENALVLVRRLPSFLALACATCDAPLHPPFIVWEAL